MAYVNTAIERNAVTLEAVEAAAREYIALRDRQQHPAGRFDRKGRFELAQTFECCRGIRAPSKRYPYPEMLHGRTVIHVAHIHGLPVEIVRRAVFLVETDAEGYTWPVRTDTPPRQDLATDKKLKKLIAAYVLRRLIGEVA